MARRRSSRFPNPGYKTVAAVGVGAIVLGGLGYFGIRALSDRSDKKALSKLPKPGGPKVPVPEDFPEGDALGDSYPGFVPDGEGWVPGGDTPAGIYVADGCTDFVFVAGEEGQQIDYLEGLVSNAVAESSGAASVSADPTAMATQFLAHFWGECTWPPTQAAPERIRHLYQAVTYVIARTIVADGGRVLGTTDPDVLDELVADRLSELGLIDFDPDVVPEINVPSALPDSVGGGGSGAHKMTAYLP